MCPKCKKYGTVCVEDIALNTDDNEIYRQKTCTECGGRFFTIEFEVECDEAFQRNWNKYCEPAKYYMKRRG